MTSGPGESLEVAAPGFAARGGLPLEAAVETLLPEGAATALSETVPGAVVAKDAP